MYVLYLACRHPRVRWYTKALAVSVIAYAASPIDLIPDFIPVLGYLDDVIIVPLGFLLTVRTLPRALLEELRNQAAVESRSPRGRWLAAGMIACAWAATLGLVLYVAFR